MQQNDTTNLTGLIQDIERMTGLGTGNISGNPTKYKEFTARMNNWYDREVATILAADTRWNWDDSNYTDLPIGTADIVSGQSIYQFDPSWIRVINIQMADATTGTFADMVPDDHHPERPIQSAPHYSAWFHGCRRHDNARHRTDHISFRRTQGVLPTEREAFRRRRIYGYHEPRIPDTVPSAAFLRTRIRLLP
jgi:hypothetical protein